MSKEIKKIPFYFDISTIKRFFIGEELTIACPECGELMNYSEDAYISHPTQNTYEDVYINCFNHERYLTFHFELKITGVETNIIIEYDTVGLKSCK